LKSRAIFSRAAKSTNWFSPTGAAQAYNLHYYRFERQLLVSNGSDLREYM
jgi:hypothetical protein